MHYRVVVVVGERKEKERKKREKLYQHVTANRYSTDLERYSHLSVALAAPPPATVAAPVAPPLAAARTPATVAAQPAGMRMATTYPMVKTV